MHANETVLFQDQDTLVTNARFTTSKHMFPLNTIISVSRAGRPASRAWPSLGAFFFLLLALPAFSGKTGHAVFFIPCLFFLYRRVRPKDVHIVLVNVAGANREALASHDPIKVTKVLEALHRAIIERG